MNVKPLADLLSLTTLQIRDDDGGKEWFTCRHDPSKGQSGTILRLLHVR